MFADYYCGKQVVRTKDTLDIACFEWVQLLNLPTLSSKRMGQAEFNVIR